MKYKEVIDRVINTLSATNKDSFIPRRYILSLMKTKLEEIASKILDSRPTFRDMSLFKWVNCVEMESVDSFTCGRTEVLNCGDLVKTKKPLTGAVWTKFGSTIIKVTNIDNTIEYKLVTPAYYEIVKSRRGAKRFKQRYAIIYPDNNIYIPGSQVEIINVLLFTSDEKIDSGQCDDCEGCRDFYDSEITLPGKFQDTFVQAVIQEASMRVRIPKDENPNLDSNQKSQTIQ